MVERFLHFWQTHLHESTWGRKKKRVIEIILNGFKIVDSCGMFWRTSWVAWITGADHAASSFLSQRSAGTQETNSLQTNLKPPYTTTTASASHDVRDLHKGRLLFFPRSAGNNSFTASTHMKTSLKAGVQPTSGCVSHMAEETGGFHGKAALETQSHIWYFGNKNSWHAFSANAGTESKADTCLLKFRFSFV